MADYISREAAVEKITFLCELREIVCNPDDEFLRGLKNALNAVKSNEIIPSADVQPVVETEDLATATEQFICKNCGIRIENFDKVILEEDNDGYIDKLFCEYIFKFCPECGAKVESRIKTPKRDKPLYTMDEICKMNGVEFNLRKDDDTND